MEMHLQARLAAAFDDVITLAGRHEVPATKFELLTAVALKLHREAARVRSSTLTIRLLQAESPKSEKHSVGCWTLFDTTETSG